MVVLGDLEGLSISPKQERCLGEGLRLVAQTMLWLVYVPFLRGREKVYPIKRLQIMNRFSEAAGISLRNRLSVFISYDNRFLPPMNHYTTSRTRGTQDHLMKKQFCRRDMDFTPRKCTQHYPLDYRESRRMEYFMEESSVVETST